MFLLNNFIVIFVLFEWCNVFEIVFCVILNKWFLIFLGILKFCILCIIFIGIFFCKLIIKFLIFLFKDLFFKLSGFKCNSKVCIFNCEFWIIFFKIGICWFNGGFNFVFLIVDSIIFVVKSCWLIELWSFCVSFWCLFLIIFLIFILLIL